MLRMMKMIKTGITWFSLGLCTCFFSCTTEVTPGYHLFKGEKGWGYNILVNDRIFIHQETIPALPVNTGFPDSIRAKKTAELVIRKMASQQYPVLSTTDVTLILTGRDE